MDYVELIGRIVFALMFINSGVNHFLKREAYVAYSRSENVPAPTLAVLATGAMIGVGGLLISLGAWGDLGALLIAAFLVPTAYFMHGFWRHDDPQMRANQQAHFMKNLSLAGAALVLFYLFQQFGDQIGLTLTGPLFG